MNACTWWATVGSSELDVNPLIPPSTPSAFYFPCPGLTNIPSILPTWWLPPNTGVVSRFATYSLAPCKHSPSSQLLGYILALLLKREWIITSLIAYTVSLGLFHVGLPKYAPPKILIPYSKRPMVFCRVVLLCGLLLLLLLLIDVSTSMCAAT